MGERLYRTIWRLTGIYFLIQSLQGRIISLYRFVIRKAESIYAVYLMRHFFSTIMLDNRINRYHTIPYRNFLWCNIVVTDYWIHCIEMQCTESIPKGTDFRKLTDEFIHSVQLKLNRRPRKKLNFSTPKDEFFRFLL